MTGVYIDVHDRKISWVRRRIAKYIIRFFANIRLYNIIPHFFKKVNGLTTLFIKIRMNVRLIRTLLYGIIVFSIIFPFE